MAVVVPAVTWLELTVVILCSAAVDWFTTD